MGYFCSTQLTLLEETLISINTGQEGIRQVAAGDYLGALLPNGFLP